MSYGDMWDFLDGPDPNKDKPVQERFLHKLKQRKRAIAEEVRQFNIELKGMQELQRDFHNQKANITRVKNRITVLDKERESIDRDLAKVK